MRKVKQCNISRGKFMLHFMLSKLCVMVLVFSRSLALECYSGSKDENDQWNEDHLSKESCSGEICSIQVRVNENGKSSIKLGCTEIEGYVSDVGCSNLPAYNMYKTAMHCVCSYAMCNVDLLLGRYPESIVHLKAVLPRPAWNPSDAIEDCEAN